MRIYLVRHAIAEERGAAWPDDAARPLTARGVARFREVAARLADRGVHVDRVWASPLLRARQTAALLAPLWTTAGRAETIATIADLAPGHPPSGVLARLRGVAPAEAVALVGHQPDLGVLAAWLIGAASPLPFRKGGVARVDCASGLAPGAGRLVWLVTPRLLLED